MKLKSSVSRPYPGSSEDERRALALLVIETNSPELRDRSYDLVKVPHLRVPLAGSLREYGPGEDFTQDSDRTVPSKRHKGVIGVDVTLSGISKTSRRADDDFWNALDEMQELYADVIRRNLLVGMKAQLYVRMAVDKPIPLREDKSQQTTLLEEEAGALLVEGERTSFSESDSPLLEAELESLLGCKETVDLLLSHMAELARSQSSVPV